MGDKRSNLSAAMKALWADPEYRAKQLARRQTPEHRAKLLARSQAQWGDPECRAKHREGMIAAWERREERTLGPSEAKKIASKARWQDPEYRAKMSAAYKAAWKRRRAAKDT